MTLEQIAQIAVDGGTVEKIRQALAVHVSQAVKAEREACAAIVEGVQPAAFFNAGEQFPNGAALAQIADRIRKQS